MANELNGEEQDFIEEEEFVEEDEQETEDEEEQEEETEDEEEPEEDERTTALEKKVKTLEEQKNHWRKKATEKAESKSTKAVKDISTTDMFALIKADVQEEDIPEVKEYATLKGISISEALKTSVMKTILADNVEKRATVKATNRKVKRAGTKDISGSALQKELSQGKVPKPNSQEAEALFWARRGGRPD